MDRRADIAHKDGYRIVVLSTTVLALLVIIALVRWWPVDGTSPEPALVEAGAQEQIQVDEIRPTRQSTDLRPPPPAPLPPILVADDVIIEQDELDLTERFLPIEEPGLAAPAAPAGETAMVYEGPKPIRVVEPEYTRAAHRRRVRAEVVVGVRVDERGRVSEAWVMKRLLLGDDDEGPREVESLGYGLEEAAMAAAERCLFRPARRNGQAVESETTLGFGFGV